MGVSLRLRHLGTGKGRHFFPPAKLQDPSLWPESSCVQHEIGGSAVGLRPPPSVFGLGS